MREQEEKSGMWDDNRWEMGLGQESDSIASTVSGIERRRREDCT